MKSPPAHPCTLLGASLSMAILVGCGGPNPASDTTYAELIDALRSRSVTQLDDSDIRLVSSADPSGGNRDYSHVVRIEDGWVVIGDFEGPGVLLRWWCTGILRGQRFQFFFDDEDEPRIDLTLDEMRASTFPFPEALARFEQRCWISYVPIPYTRRLVVKVEDRGYRPGDSWPRLFYQLEVWTPPEGLDVPSLPVEPTPTDLAALTAFGDEFKRPLEREGAVTQAFTADLKPGETTILTSLEGPGRITGLDLTPAWDTLPDTIAGDRLIRDAVLQIAWDDAASPAVNVPLGDFFGSVWGRRRFQNRWFGMEGDTFQSRWPMPFRTSAQIMIRNDGDATVTVAGNVTWVEGDEPAPGEGYFHAAWNRTDSASLGRPHVVLDAPGHGTYAGCLLSVSGDDSSWWILESDESMFRNGETTPFWQGTGLEDYFNGSWYYQFAWTRPLHGLLFKSPFQTIQYRLQDQDAAPFEDGMRVEFERGPGHQSRGVIESVAFSYLASPDGSARDLPQPRGIPISNVEQQAIMSALFNWERLGDYEGASAHIDRFLARHPDLPFGDTLRLRQLAYRERLGLLPDPAAAYTRFAGETASPAAAKWAQLLAWFHEAPQNAILMLYSSAPARLYLDGKPVLETKSQGTYEVTPVRLTPGTHALSMRLDRDTAGPTHNTRWWQAALRTHEGLVATNPDWRWSYQFDNGAMLPGFDDSAWIPVEDSISEGPPEVPFLGCAPHPLVDFQTSAPTHKFPKTQIWPQGVTSLLVRGEFTFGTEPR